MKFILSLVIIFVLIILQSSLYPHLAIYGAFPNLILIVLVILNILRSYKKNLIWVMFGGLFLDIFSFNNFLGISIVGLFLISYLIHFLSQTTFRKTSIFPVILFGIGATLIYKFFLILVFLITKTSFELSFSQVFSQIIYNTLLLIPLFYLIKKLQHA
jgi:rod shape-determining protein MreD